MEATKIEKMAMDEFIRAYAQDGPFELIDGERRLVLPTVAGPNWRMNLLLLLLSKYVTEHELGTALMETTFVLTFDRSRWVTGSRQPDVCFFAASRWEKYVEDNPDWETRPVVLVPDLAVEIVSPTDHWSDALAKAKLYLADGVQLVWLIDTPGRRARVYENGDARDLDDTRDLNGGLVIPGFVLPLRVLFNTKPSELKTLL